MDPHPAYRKGRENIMACDIEQPKMDMCALKKEGDEECIKSLGDKPAVVFGNCGAKFDSSHKACSPWKSV
jgi:hypothetical protein